MAHKIPYIKYLSALLLFGLNGVVAGHIALGSTEIVVLRSLLGTLFLLAVFFLTRQRVTCLKEPRRLLLVALSGVAMGLSWLCLYRAYQLVGVSIATLLYYCGPVLLIALSPLFFKEKLTVPKLAGIAVVFFGVVMLNGVDGGTLDAGGLLCGLGGAVLYVFMVITNKKAALPGLENTAIQLLSAFAVTAVYMLVRSGTPAVPAESWPWILLLGIVNTGFGCWLYFSSIGALPVQTVSICGYLEPLSAVFFSVLLLDETLTPARWLGAAMVLGGAMLAEFIHPRKEQK